MRRRRFHAGYRPSSASPSRPLHQGRDGSMRSSSTASACPRALSADMCDCLTRTGLDWSDKYPNVVAALAKVRANTAYLDGELCGVGDDGLPSFSQTQAASDGSHGVRLVYYVFDLLHLDGGDTASLPLIERKALLKPLVAGRPKSVAVALVSETQFSALRRARVSATGKTEIDLCSPPTSLKPRGLRIRAGPQSRKRTTSASRLRRFHRNEKTEPALCALLARTIAGRRGNERQR